MKDGPISPCPKPGPAHLVPEASAPFSSAPEPSGIRGSAPRETHGTLHGFTALHVYRTGVKPVHPETGSCRIVYASLLKYSHNAVNNLLSGAAPLGREWEKATAVAGCCGNAPSSYRPCLWKTKGLSGFPGQSGIAACRQTTGGRPGVPASYGLAAWPAMARTAADLCRREKPLHQPLTSFP